MVKVTQYLTGARRVFAKSHFSMFLLYQLRLLFRDWPGYFGFEPARISCSGLSLVLLSLLWRTSSYVNLSPAPHT